jgi:fructose-1,6-bisphosphatase
MIEIAGGKATDGIQRILEKVPTELHERTPFFIGSLKMMEELEGYLATSAGWQKVKSNHENKDVQAVIN